MHQERTLHLHFPLGQTFVLALLILALVALAAEGITRLALSGEPQAIGSANPTLDVKIGQLDRLAEQTGGVDCIYLGSSVVQNGIQPDRVAAAYHAQTGRTITCYNFGVPALTARTAGVLAEVLVERYQPDLLVYGFTLRALAENAGQAGEVYDAIAHTPWVEYQRGEFAPMGWLVAHSTALRTYLALRNWMQADFPAWRRSFTETSPDGYQPFYGSGKPVDLDAIHVPDYFANYTMSPVEFAGLAQIVTLQGQTNVLLVEMPLPVQLITQFKGGAEAYTAEIEALAAYAAEHGARLWTTSPLEMIPDNGWAEDAHHVNRRGMKVLSAWLGEQFGSSGLVSR